MISLDDLDVDNLFDLMPQSVRVEYQEHGDASIFGFSPGVKHWLETSTHPRVEKWRNDLKRYTAENIRQALKEQTIMADLGQQLPTGKSKLLRPMTVPLHPVLKGRMEAKDRHAWKDPHAIKDTKKRHPKLFY